MATLSNISIIHERIKALAMIVNSANPTETSLHRLTHASSTPRCDRLG